MKPTHINHPLREIRLSYNSERNVSSFEYDAIIKYQLLHNEVYQQKNEWLTLKKEIAERVKDYEELDSALLTVENELKLYRELAGFSNEELGDFIFPDNYSLDYNETAAHANDYQVLIDEKWELLDGTRKLYKELNDRYERLGEEYEHYCDSYFHPIIKDWKNVEIEIVSFDRDMNDFRLEWDHLYKLEQSAISDLNNLNVLLKSLKERTDKLQEHMDFLFEKVTSVALMRKTEGEGFSEN